MLGRSLKSGDSSYGRILIAVPDKPLPISWSAIDLQLTNATLSARQKWSFGRSQPITRLTWTGETETSDRLCLPDEGKALSLGAEAMSRQPVRGCRLPYIQRFAVRWACA